MRSTLPGRALAALFACDTAIRPVELSAQPTTTQPKEGSVNDRRQDQELRIAKGVQFGRLTLARPRIFEGREAKLNRETKDDRRAGPHCAGHPQPPDDCRQSRQDRKP